ncbi:MAG: STAS domain-containing protein, partial [Candidatus Gastranaerophilales bacterium]|nr:STAS domain-containing protein [Candidatus Gastranaerophilales bacterium]
NIDFEKTKNIMLDFSNIDNIDLKEINILLNIKKIALLNNNSLKISNINPNIRNLLDITGLNKTIDSTMTNPIERKKD